MFVGEDGSEREEEVGDIRWDIQVFDIRERSLSCSFLISLALKHRFFFIFLF